MRTNPDAAVAITRRQFLACCSALSAAAGVACTTATRDTRSAYALVTDPPLTDYEQILDGLIQTVLPLELPTFPVTAPQIKARLLDLFHLERDSRFLLLQRSFMLFEQTDLFPHSAPLSGERDRTEGPGTRDSGSRRDDVAHDGALYARFAQSGAPLRFTRLSLDRQRDYFDLWRQSRFVLRREFHATARSLVMLTAYSMPETWVVIGYGGPLLGPARS